MMKSNDGLTPTDDHESTISEEAVEKVASMIEDMDDDSSETSGPTVDETSKTSSGSSMGSAGSKGSTPGGDHADLESVIEDVSRKAGDDTMKTINKAGLAGAPSMSFGKTAIVFMIIGLVIVVMSILSGGALPIPPLRRWNVFIGVFLICYGFLFGLHWV